MKVVDAYRAADMNHDADLFETCSDPAHFVMLKPGASLAAEVVSVIACSDNPTHYAKAICPSCDLRTCPDCAHRNGARLLNRYMPALQKHFDNPRHGWRFRKITMTTAFHVRDGDIQERISEMYGSLREMFTELLESHQNGPYSVSECGFVISHEFGPKGLKLHFHILFYGPNLAQDDLSKAWSALTGYPVVYISEIGKGKRLENLERAAAETLKYTTKFWKRNKRGQIIYVKPELVPVIHNAIAGTRRIRSWGLFYNIGEEQEPSACPECGEPVELVRREQWPMLLENHAARLQKEGEKNRVSSHLKSTLANKSGREPPIMEINLRKQRQSVPELYLVAVEMAGGWQISQIEKKEWKKLGPTFNTERLVIDDVALWIKRHGTEHDELLDCEIQQWFADEAEIPFL